MIATPRPLTYDDLLEFPDDGQRYEIIGGELIVNPASVSNHQRVLLRLIRLIDDCAQATGAGELFVAPLAVKLGRHDVVEPDLVFLSSARPPLPGNENSIDYAPDLLVEIISPSSRRNDRVRKMALYAPSGVPEYWIADRLERALTVNALQGDRYVAVEPDDDGSINSPTFAGLRVDPATIFAGFD